MPVPSTPQEIERWNRMFAAAAKLQSVIPKAFLVGGTAVGIYAPYRTSRDADQLMADLPRHCTDMTPTESGFPRVNRVLPKGLFG